MHETPCMCLQDAPAWLADFCRKVCALADAQQRASDAQRALSSLAHCTALLLQLGFASPSAWQPLVQAFVRVQADQPASDEQQQHAAPAAVPPSRRGRAAASKKSATAAAPDASSLSQPAASNLLLVEGLLLREAELPRGSIAAVVEVELHCWAAAQADGMGAAGCRHTVQRLLQAVFPAEQRPVEHAAALLALHQLGMPAEDGRVGSWLLERAVQAVNKVGRMGCCLRVLRLCASRFAALPHVVALSHDRGSAPHIWHCPFVLPLRRCPAHRQPPCWPGPAACWLWTLPASWQPRRC